MPSKLETALAELASDNGFTIRPINEVDWDGLAEDNPEWTRSALEAEANGLTEAEALVIAAGEQEEMDAASKKAPNLADLLEAIFVGDLNRYFL